MQTYTDRRCRVVGTPAPYSEGPGYQQSWLRVFMAFLSTFRNMSGTK